MSKTTIALEAAVAVVIENRAAEGERPTARQRANVDRAFAHILKLIAPRIRHFIRQYGLVAHWDDAEQCCAIGVHRAIEAYDPTKAQFTTFVNWQLRGELQSLRFRLMTDQRASAKKVEATTVSLHAFTTGADGEEASLESVIEDEAAEALTESAASDYLARRATAALIDEYVAHNRKLGLTQLGKRPRPKRAAVREALPGVPRLRSSIDRLDPAEVEKLDQKLARDREILERRVFDDATLDDIGNGTGITKERIRQISKSATKSMAELAASHPRFTVMADYGEPAPLRRKAPADPAPAAAQVPLLPDPQLEQNQALRVVAVDPSATAPSAAVPGWRGDEALLAAGFTYEESASEPEARPEVPPTSLGSARAA